MNTLWRNTIKIGVNNVAIMAIAFVYSVLVARVLGPAAMGVLSLLLVTPSLLNQLMGLGIQQTMSYVINAKKYSTREVTNHTFGFSILLGLVVGCALWLIYVPSESLLSGAGKISPVGVTAFLAVFTAVNYIRVNLIGLLYGMEKYESAARFNLFNEGLILVGALVGLIMDTFNIGYLISIILAVNFLGTILLWLTLSWVVGHKPVPRISLRLLKFQSSYSLALFVTSVLQSLQTRVHFYIVAFFLGPQSLGYFSIASGLGEKVLELSRPLVVTHFPHSTKISSKDKKGAFGFTSEIVSLLVPATVVVLFVYVLAIRFLVPIVYSNLYLPVVYPAILLGFASGVWGVIKILSNYLATIEKNNVNAAILLCLVLINVAVGYLLLANGYGLLAIAGTTLIASILALSMQIGYISWLGQPIGELKPNFKRSISLALSLVSRFMPRKSFN